MPSLQALLDTDYRKLSGEGARIYRGAGVHPGPELDVWAVAALLESDARTAAKRMRELADLGLVRPVSGLRYRLPGHVHEHAGMKAREAGSAEERAGALHRFARYYLAGSVAVSAYLGGGAPYGAPLAAVDGPALPDF
uniref:hypothetical protein n=1 Tax=Allosalinactinospora lopnorensis TaxID=1352348 RepID=UPI000623BAAE